MVYQDHLTKFVILRALQTKRAAEVAYQLTDVFLLFGAPVILQSDNGSEFTADVIRELKLMWPELTLVHGKPRHPQSQGSVERANSDIKDMLISWLSDNNTRDWVSGIKFVQFYKNSAHHAGIQSNIYFRRCLCVCVCVCLYVCPARPYLCMDFSLISHNDSCAFKLTPKPGFEIKIHLIFF